MIVNGDSSTQFTDLFLECPTLLTSVTGLEIGGNVGGVEIPCGDILENYVNISIDRFYVNLPNQQIFLGPNLALDLTTGGANHDLNVLDAGGSNSLLFISGTWFASAQSDCINFNSGVAWRVNMTGGTVFNCRAAGIYVNSQNVVMNISGTYFDQDANYGINNPLGSVKKCGVGFGGNNGPANTSGTIGSNC